MITVNLFSEKNGEINHFLSSLYNTNLDIPEQKSWEKIYTNPIEIADIIMVSTSTSLTKMVMLSLNTYTKDFLIKLICYCKRNRSIIY